MNRFYIQKDRHFSKNQDSLRYVFNTKSQTLHVTRFLMNFLKLVLQYKNDETLRYMTFLYTKSQTLGKKQDNLRYVFLYKNPGTLRYAIFDRIF